jgi:hypothetical protein
MPSFNERRLPAAEQTQREQLCDLVIAYEAVRCTRCPERDTAERALGIALARCYEPFVCGQWAYRWDWHEDSITRRPAIAVHRPPRRQGPDQGIVSMSARRRNDVGEVFGGWTLKGRAI